MSGRECASNTSTVTSNITGAIGWDTDGTYYVTWLDPSEGPEKQGWTA